MNSAGAEFETRASSDDISTQRGCGENVSKGLACPELRGEPRTRLTRSALFMQLI